MLFIVALSAGTAFASSDDADDGFIAESNVIDERGNSNGYSTDELFSENANDGAVLSAEDKLGNSDGYSTDELFSENANDGAVLSAGDNRINTTIRAFTEVSYSRPSVAEGLGVFAFNLTPSDSYSPLLVTKNIIVQFNDEVPVDYSVILGEGKYTIPNGTAAGNYSISLTFAGDDEYAPSCFTTVIEVFDVATEIVPLGNLSYPRPVVIEDLGYYPIVLRTNTTVPLPLANRSIWISFGGRDSVEVPTDKNGEIYYIIPNDAEKGNYTIIAGYAGEDGYIDSLFKATIEIYDVPTKLLALNNTIFDNSSVIGGKAIYPIKLVTNTTDALSLGNKSVWISYEDKPYENYTTDSYGMIYYPVPEDVSSWTKEGYHNVTMFFIGEGYIYCKLDTKMMVGNLDTQIIIPGNMSYPRYVVIGGQGYYPLMLTTNSSIDEYGRIIPNPIPIPLVNKTVWIQFESQAPINYTTDEFGLINYTIPYVGKEGNYTIRANFSEYGYVGSDFEVTLEIYDAESFVIAENVTVDYGDDVNISVTSTNAYRINYQIIDWNGNTVFAGTVGPDEYIFLLDLAAGNYTVNLTTIAIGEYDSANNVSSITVNPVESSVIVGNVSYLYGATVAVLPGSVGAVNITYKILKDNFTVVENTIMPGKYLPDLNLAVGSYVVVWTAAGDENHTSGSNVSYITVYPAESHVFAENITVDYGDEIVVPVGCSGVVNVTYQIIRDESVVAEGTLAIGEKIAGLDLAAGSYVVVLTAGVDENHTSSSYVSSITVNPVESYVSVSDFGYLYGATFVVQPMSVGAVNITYRILKDGVSVVEDTIVPGGFIRDLDLAVGSYVVVWTAVADENHTSSTNVSSIIVYPAGTFVFAENVTVDYGDEIVVPVGCTAGVVNVTYQVIRDESVVAEGTVAIGEKIAGLDLAAGSYVVVLTAGVDSNHTSSSHVSSITVNPVESSVSVGNFSLTYGAAVVVQPMSVGAVNITYRVLKDGVAVVEGTILPGGYLPDLDLAVGSYVVVWTAAADENHTSSSNVSSITVKPAGSRVSAENITVNYGDEIIVHVASAGAVNVTYQVIRDESVVAEGTVAIGEDIAGLDLAAGSYVVVLTTGVDSNHTSSGNVAYIDVSPAGSRVSAENITVNYGDEIIVPVAGSGAVNVAYQVIKDGSVVADGTVAAGGDIAGLDLTPGNYAVNLTAVPDENHTSISNTSSITVLLGESHVSAEDVSVTYGEDLLIVVTSENAIGVTYQVIDEDGNVAAEGNVEPYNLQSILRASVTSKGAIAGLKLSAGEYTVNLTTVPEEYYAPANYVSSLSVSRADSSVKGEDVQANVGDSISVPVTSENATAISYQVIDAKDKVVAKGTVSPDENINLLNLAAGRYTLNLTANTDGNYAPSTYASTITVNKIPSSVVATASDINFGDDETISIDVGPKDAGGKVNITVNGKLYPNIQVSKGNAQLTVSGLSAGKYAVDVEYSGDAKYLPSEGSTAFKVEKSTPEISIDPTTDGDGNLVVRLPDDATGDVTIEIDGKTYTEPVVNGKAVFDISDIAPGSYDIDVSYSGDDNYNPVNTEATVEVLSEENTVDVLSEENNNNSQNDKIEHLKTGLSVHETANPIMALVVVLMVLGFSRLRRLSK